MFNLFTIFNVYHKMFFFSCCFGHGLFKSISDPHNKQSRGERHNAQSREPELPQHPPSSARSRDDNYVMHLAMTEALSGAFPVPLIGE